MHAIALSVVILFCLWAITDRHVPTGIVITSGLAMVVCGCLGALDDNAYFDRAFVVRTWGLVTIGWGFFWRFTGRGLWMRVSMRWGWLYIGTRWFGLERRAHRRSE